MKISPTRLRLEVRRSALLPIGAVALVFLGAAPEMTLPAAKTAKTEEARPLQLTWDAASIDTDFKTGILHLKGDVLITYGTMTVKADRALATSLDSKDSRWTFDGNVRINAEPRGNLRSDEAVVEFQDRQLKRATATGNPAEFDQKRADSDEVARGHASQIVYEVGAGTIRLSKDAWITDGRNELSSPLIVYNLVEEHVQAFSSHDGAETTAAPPNGETRVHVTIAPNEAPKLDGAGTNKPKPAAADPQQQPQPPGSSATASAPPPSTPR
jgi:lipopolysaccharide transport protein LptA